MLDFIQTYEIKESDFDTGLYANTGEYMINANDIQLIESEDLRRIDGEDYIAVYCKHQTASSGMFVFMAILAALFIGVPWFIAYCAGCFMKRTKYYVKFKDLVKMRNKEEVVKVKKEIH